MEPREVWGRATGSDDFSLLFNLSGTKLYVLRMEDPSWRLMRWVGLWRRQGEAFRKGWNARVLCRRNDCLEAPGRCRDDHRSYDLLLKLERSCMIDVVLESMEEDIASNMSL
jgi:hypothetical protein